MTIADAGSVHQRLVVERFAGVRLVFDERAVLRVVEEREDDDARDARLAGARFVVADAPVRVFLGAMSP